MYNQSPKGGELLWHSHLEVIDRICNYFDCRIEDVIEHYEPRKEETNE